MERDDTPLDFVAFRESFKSFQLVLFQQMALDAVTGQVAGQVTGQVTGQVDSWVINVLRACSNPAKSADIQKITGIKHRETFQRNYLDYLLQAGLLVRTIPDKPKSRLQKYRITQKGQELLKGK